MKKIVFIINPNSGNGYGAEIGKKISKLAPSLRVECEILYTKNQGDATRFADKYTKSDDVVIISVGGDGTMNEVLNGIHAGVTMGIIPSGSGNDFFRIIDPHITDIEELIKQTIAGTIRYIDYGIVNGKKFLGSFSVGLDANVVDGSRKIQQKNKRVRKSGYILAALAEVIKPNPFNMTFEDAQINVNQSCLFVSALNGQYYGGGFNSAPDADIEDGLLDINIVEAMKPTRIVSLLPVYMQGKHYGLKEVIIHQSNRFTMTCDREMTAQVDGELFRASKFDVQVVNKGIPFLIAKGINKNENTKR